MDVATILGKLTSSDVSASVILEKYGPNTHDQLWRDNPVLYREFVKKLIGEDRLITAMDLAGRGIRQFPHDFELRYQQTLVHSRARSRGQARDKVKELLADVKAALIIQADVLCLAGRLRKDEFSETNNPARRKQLASESASLYQRARELHESAFATINAATMQLLAGDQEKARELASRAIELTHSEDADQQSHWAAATIGEAALIRGDVEQAKQQYYLAVQRAGNRVGDISSMGNNVRLLAGLTDDANEILTLLAPGTVVVFAGHMIDHPLRTTDHGLPARFPDDERLVKAVNEAISQKLDELNVSVGYCSAASGSDLIFARQMLQREKELHVVLPFDKDDFCTTSVDFGYDELGRWRKEFNDVIKGATDVHFATEDLYLGHEILFEFVNSMTQGIAINHATRLRSEPVALVVHDLESPRQIGGTIYFRDRWTENGRNYERIDLAELRSRITGGPLANTPVDSSRPPREVLRVDVQRRVQFMLFADVKGFSKLREEEAPGLFVQLIDLVAGLIKSLDEPPEFENTWGDGLFVVFGNVAHAAEFALKLVEKVQQHEWIEYGLDLTPGIRIGMHAGPVYRRRDDIVGRANFFGRHVNLAARIEPVTEVDCVYTSEQFAAILALNPNHAFVCEYVGLTALPKGSGEVPLYRLRRRGRD